MLEHRQITGLKENEVDFGILSVSRLAEQFGRKRCQKKRKDMDYKPLYLAIDGLF